MCVNSSPRGPLETSAEPADLRLASAKRECNLPGRARVISQTSKFKIVPAKMQRDSDHPQECVLPGETCFFFVERRERKEWTENKNRRKFEITLKLFYFAEYMIFAIVNCIFVPSYELKLFGMST